MGLEQVRVRQIRDNAALVGVGIFGEGSGLSDGGRRRLVWLFGRRKEKRGEVGVDGWWSISRHGEADGRRGGRLGVS